MISVMPDFVIDIEKNPVSFMPDYIGLTVDQVLAAVTVRVLPQYCPGTSNQAWNEALLK